MELTQKYMEKKFVKVPFDLEMAKKITSGGVDGRIVTRDGNRARIVCWNKKSDSIYNVVALIDVGIMEKILTYTINGSVVAGENRDNDLMIEIPEYRTFKDGDIIKQSNDAYTWLSIIKNINIGADKSTYNTDDYVSLLITDKDSMPSFNTSSSAGKKIEKPTKEEVQILIDSLKVSKDPEAKECLKRFFGVEEKPKYEFKPFDKVLVRDSTSEDWTAAFFSHVGDNPCRYYASGSCYAFCIPYNERTKHLLGTTDNWKG